MLWQFVRNNIDLDDKENIIKIMDNIEIKLKNENNIQTVFLDGEDVTDQIRLPEVNNTVSLTSSIPEVREKVTELERKIGYDWLKEGKNIIMEGRDINYCSFSRSRNKNIFRCYTCRKSKKKNGTTS